MDGAAEQPAPEPPSPEDRESGDAALYVRLIKADFTGPDFDAVASALVRYAHTVLSAWLISGQIVQECAHKDVGGLGRLRSGEVTLTRDDIEDLVQETLRRALERFIQDGRAGGGWSPLGGTALTTYFVGNCVLRFGDAYKSWEREHHHVRLPLDPDLFSRHRKAGDDPLDLLIQRDKIAEVLPPPGWRRTEVLLHAAGYTDDEIARIIGNGATAGAVATRRYRYRKTLGGGQRP
jgi:DNA-directed RNA polymerase specialized sigma24 family protein